MVLSKRAADVAFGEATVARICREEYWRGGSLPTRAAEIYKESPESFGSVLICMCVKGKVVPEAGG